MIKNARVFALILLTLLFSGSARGQLTFSLMENSKEASPGEIVSFIATLTNIGNDSIFLNSDTISQFGTWNGLSIQDNFGNTPFPLLSGEQWTDKLFDITVDNSALPQSYIGTYSIFGGTDDLANDLLASPQGFEVRVIPSVVPEPSGIVLTFATVFVTATCLCCRGLKLLRQSA